MAQLPQLFLLCLLAAIIFLAATVMFYSLTFWLRRGNRLSEQLFEILIMFSCTPQHAQPIGIKFVLFSVMPAGFISLIPVSLVQRFDIVQYAILIAATAFYSVLAVLVFNAGLRRYVSDASV